MEEAGAQKRPVYVRLRGAGPFGFAGLFSRRTAADGERACATAIITTGSNDLLRPVHDRMPVIALPERAQLWLDPVTQDRNKLLDLLRPYPSTDMELFDVSPRVNSPANDSPENILPYSNPSS